MSHIFVSYSRRNIEFAERIVQALKENELETWIDWNSIPKGEDWEQEIYRGIEAANAFLLLISADSVRSEMCNKEILHAVKNGKRILPIFISSVENREVYVVTEGFLNEEAKTEINRRNFIFCRNEMDDFQKAVYEIRTTIRTDYEWLKYQTTLQVKALDWERRQENSGLLRRSILREAEEQLTAAGQKDPPPTDLQRRYVLESRRRENRNRNLLLTAAGVAIVALSFLSLFAFNQRQLANNNALTAIANEHGRATAQVDAENQKGTAVANEQKAIEQAQIALARQLASQAQAVNTTFSSRQLLATLLDIQSMKLFPTGDAARFLINVNHSTIPVALMTHDSGVPPLLSARMEISSSQAVATAQPASGKPTPETKSHA